MKISVITCTYNQKELLKETIESVQKSILAPFDEVTWEHLIYDDSSTDGTQQMMETASWPHVFYYRSEKNKGPSYGRNQLIEKATGDYIFMLDGDDIILQRTLHNFIRLAKRHPESTWFVADFLRVDKELKYIVGNDYYTWDFKDTEAMLTSIFKSEYFIQSNVYIKKSLFKEVGGFDESMRMTEDLDLFIRFLLAGHMPHYAPFVTHLHRYHDHNLSKGVDLTAHKHHMVELAKRYAR